MASIKTPTEVAEDYLDELQSLKPGLNRDQKDSEWWIRSRVNGSIVAGVYSDQRLIANDAFPQQSRHDAIQRQLDLYLERDFLPATKGQGKVAVTGNPGDLETNLSFTYPPNGNVYVQQEPITFDGLGFALVPVESVAAGQSQNLNDGAILTIPSPPAGVNATAVVSGGISDARDPESDLEARSAVLTRIRQPLSVGRVSDYIQYAKLADPSVVTASVQRFPFGFGTVGVYITSGTTNIDQAIDNGDPISVIPSDQLVDTVQAFLEVNRPTNDCVTVFKPAEVPIDVTVKVQLSQGTLDQVLSGQSLTQRQLVQREVKRALYKTPVGGRVIGPSGYVFASDIEETIDVKLSGEPVVAGSIPILSDRQVLALSVTGFNRTLFPNETPVPGTITVELM